VAAHGRDGVVDVGAFLGGELVESVADAVDEAADAGYLLGGWGRVGAGPGVDVGGGA
jgi:hypothetical protein